MHICIYTLPPNSIQLFIKHSQVMLALCAYTIFLCAGPKTRRSVRLLNYFEICTAAAAGLQGIAKLNNQQHVVSTACSSVQANDHSVSMTDQSLQMSVSKSFEMSVSDLEKNHCRELLVHVLRLGRLGLVMSLRQSLGCGTLLFLIATLPSPTYTMSVHQDTRMYESKYPEVDDVVMVQVKSIAEMGAYVALLEYNGIEGMILLSELSRRRIRSITKLIKVIQRESL